MFKHFQCHSEEEAVQVALQSGAAAVAAQFVLMLLCSAVSGVAPVLRGKGGFMAHQVIAGVYMVMLFVVGSQSWAVEPDALSSDPALGAAERRLFSAHATARWCCAAVLGELVLWDIPCGLLVPSLRDPLMWGSMLLGHHVVMAAVAYVGVFHLPSAYYLFFFGFVELSSIPLAVVDFFHPQKGLPELLTRSALLNVVNEASRILFALLFLVVRAVCFPYMVGLRLLPDVLAVWREQLVPAGALWPLGVIVSSSVGLTLLQLHWALLITRQVLKLLSGGDDKKQAKAE